MAKDRRLVWGTKGPQTTIGWITGKAMFYIYRRSPGCYVAQKAVEWPGGARDWLTYGVFKTLEEAKAGAT